MNRINFLVVSCLLTLLLSCGDGRVRPAETSSATFVTVLPQLPEEAPPGSSIYIRVIEVSGPDRALVGSLKAEWGLPQYRVPYRKERIREDQTYGLEIVVMSDGKPVFQNKKPFYVLTKGHGESIAAELEKR